MLTCVDRCCFFTARHIAKRGLSRRRNVFIWSCVTVLHCATVQKHIFRLSRPSRISILLVSEHTKINICQNSNGINANSSVKSVLVWDRVRHFRPVLAYISLPSNEVIYFISVPVSSRFSAVRR